MEKQNNAGPRTSSFPMLKTSSFQLICQHHSSSADCARGLSKGSNGSASLLVSTQTNFFWFGVADFL